MNVDVILFAVVSFNALMTFVNLYLSLRHAKRNKR